MTRLMTMFSILGVFALPPVFGQVSEDVAPSHASAEALSATPSTAKVIDYSDKDIIPLKTKVRFTTLIILPSTERILDFTCGDKDFWIVNGNQNFAYIKPAKPGAQSNVNLVTASGNVYSFSLSEVSHEPHGEPDLKVFVALKDEAMVAATRVAPKFVSSQELETFRHQLSAAQDQVRETKESEQSTIDKGIRHFVTNVRFVYQFEAGKKPFFVRAMYHDEHFTYIQARPEETPTLYEVKDGKPNLVNFEYRDGVYVVGKILDRGYLVIGKQKLSFTREE